MIKSAYLRQKALISFLAILVSFLSFSQAFAADKKVLLLPLALYADPAKDYLRQGIMSMLASRLAGEGLQIISSQASPTLREGEEKIGITSPERAGELAETFRADYALFGSITGTGTGYSLDLSILDRAEEPPRVTNVSEAVTEDQLIPKIADVAYDLRAIMAGVDIRRSGGGSPGETDEGGRELFLKPVEETSGFRPAGRIAVKMAIMSMDAGDLNGNGNHEIIVADREKMSVYTWTEKTLTLRDTVGAARGEEFLKVSVGDIDGNGKAEIYLAALYGSRIQSSVWEWDGKLTRKVERHPGNLHVARNHSGGPSMLLYQDSSVGSLFTGKIHMMAYDQGKLVRKDVLPDLKGAQFYTLALMDYNRNGAQDFLGLGKPSLTEEAYIHVWDMSGNVLAKANEPVGGTNNAIRHGAANPDDQPPRVSFNSKLAVMDVDKDGNKEILTVANGALTRHLDFWHYMEGNVVVFKPEGGGLVLTSKSAKFNYCLTDMQVIGNRLYIAAQEGQIATFTQGAGRIMWFE
jgi:hypothetical protein